MARVVFRVRYYSPEDAYLDANKEENKRKIANRNYYSSNQIDGHDYLSYIEEGITQSGGFDYLDYVGIHEKSIGAFDKDGILDTKKKKKLREQLRVTKSVIWDCVISPEEELSKKRLNTYEDAKALLEKCLPSFLKDNGIKYENIYWYAGLHKNTDNNHIHISFFELEPMSYRKNRNGLFYHRGQIWKGSINNMRVRLEEALDSNEFFFAQYQRQALKDVEGVLDTSNKPFIQDKTIRDKLAEIYKQLPKGKANYMNKEMASLRPLIDEITLEMLKQNPDILDKYFSMKQELRRHDEYIKTICESQNVEPSRFMLTDKLIEDFHRRCGNQIINYCKKYEWHVHYEGMSYEKQRKHRNISKKKRMLLLKSTATITRMVNKEAVDVFDDFERRLKKAEYERLLEEGELEVE